MMELFNILAVLLTLTALFSYLNLRCIGLPTTIGVMFIALVVSLILVLAGVIEPSIRIYAQALVDAAHFDKTLLHGMLSYLLFAGALHVNLNDLYANRRIIGFLAIFGTLISVGILGLLTWGLLRLLEIDIPFIFCLLFGALISPTDPIAVLGILKTAGAPKSLETKITGESLFNDGVGLVLFLLILNLATGRADGESLSLGPIALFFVQEALGGIVFGLLDWIYRLQDAPINRQLLSGDYYNVGSCLGRLCPRFRTPSIRPPRNRRGRPFHRKPGSPLCHVRRDDAAP